MAWEIDDEIKLFHSLMYFKPVGMDRNFQMICLAYRLNVMEKLSYQAKDIWDRLHQLYNLEELNESEVIPYPNETKEFALPDYLDDLKSQPFPRVKRVTVSPHYLASSSLNRQRNKSGISGVSKIDDLPITPASSSPSLSPHSASSPNPSITSSTSLRRTRKAPRFSIEPSDSTMPPPSTTSISPGKSTSSAAHTPTQPARKSSRRH